LFVALHVLGQLADGGRLAGAVDARDHHHERLRTAEHERLLERRQQFDEQVAQRALHLLRVGQAAHPHLFAQRAEQVLGRVDAGIGHQQRGFELLVQRVVDLRVHEYAGDARARFREARLQAREPRFLRRCILHGRRHDFDGLDDFVAAVVARRDRHHDGGRGRFGRRGCRRNVGVVRVGRGVGLRRVGRLRFRGAGLLRFLESFEEAEHGLTSGRGRGVGRPPALAERRATRPKRRILSGAATRSRQHAPPLW